MVLSTHLLGFFYKSRNIFAFLAIKLSYFVPLYVLTLSFSLTGPGVLSASNLLLFKTPKAHPLSLSPGAAAHHRSQSRYFLFHRISLCCENSLLYFNSFLVQKKVFYEDLIF